MQITFAILLFFFSLSEVCSITLRKEIIILDIGASGNIDVFVAFDLEGKIEKKFGLAFPETEYFELIDFSIDWNGRPIKVSKQIALGDRQFTIGSLRLPAIFKFSLPPSKGNRHKLETRYKYSSLRTSGTKSPPGQYIEYILQTGAMWDHHIDEVLFLLRGKEFSCNRVFALPDSYKGKCNDKSEYEILLKNIEPKKDFRFILQDSLEK